MADHSRVSLDPVPFILFILFIVVASPTAPLTMGNPSADPSPSPPAPGEGLTGSIMGTPGVNSAESRMASATTPWWVAPGISHTKPILLPQDTRHLMDGSLAHLAANPDRLDRYPLTPAPEGTIAVMARVDLLAPGHTEFVESMGGTVNDGWDRFDVLSITIPLVSLPELTRMPGLVWLEPAITLSLLLDESVPSIGVDRVWRDHGLRGEGMTIAIVDTGIDAAHESLDDLDDDPDTDDPKVIGFYDARLGQRGEKEPFDTQGHGSHCAGIAAGTGGRNGTYIGVAPQANLVGVVVGDGGGIAMADLLDGMDWVITNRDRFSIHVMSLSLGSVLVIPGATNDGSSAISRAADAAVEAGIVTVIAVGNGNLQVAAHAGSVSAPADSFRAITVGSVDNNGYRAISSSRGPTGDGRIKPDVMAPGVGITSVNRNTGNGYVAYSGTSMACPHVAGLAALVLQACPGLTPDEVVGPVKQILHETSRHEWGDQPDPPEPWSPNNQYGWGTVDAPGAVVRALNLGSVTITPGDGHTVLPALSRQEFSIGFTYTKSEYTYQGENGDSHNPPLGSEAPDSVYLEARLPASWPRPTNLTASPQPGAGLSATVEPETPGVRESQGDWVMGVWFNYTGPVEEGQLVRSHPTLRFSVQAPASEGSELLRVACSLNGIPGEAQSETITVVSEPPDLAVTVEVNSTEPAQGETVEVIMTVRNIGEGYAASGILSLTLEGDPEDTEGTGERQDGGDTGGTEGTEGKGDSEGTGRTTLDQWQLPVLAPDGVHIIRYEWNTSDLSGGYRLTAVVSDVAPEESSTDKNVDSIMVTVREPVPDPQENSIPHVLIDSPVDGGTVSGMVEVTGTAGDHDEGDREHLLVEIRILPGDWAPVNEFTDGVWVHGWDTTTHANGQYTLGVRAHDGRNHSEVVSITVTVKNEGANTAPVARISASSADVLAGETVTFDGIDSSDEDGEVVSYLFDFGDGTDTGWQSESRASHSFSREGDYTVSLTVRDDGGATSSNTAEVVIRVREPAGGENTPPTARITSPPDEAVFPAEAQVRLVGTRSSDPDRDPLEYLWTSDLQGGLGSTATLLILLIPGDHTITLTVNDGRGGEHSDSIRITVLPPEDAGDGKGSGDGDDDDDGLLPGALLAEGMAAMAVGLAVAGARRRRSGSGEQAPGSGG